MKVLITKEMIEQRVKELGAEISDYYEGKPLTVIEAKQRMASDPGRFAEDVVKAIIEIPDEELMKIMEN